MNYVIVSNALDKLKLGVPLLEVENYLLNESGVAKTELLRMEKEHDNRLLTEEEHKYLNSLFKFSRGVYPTRSA